MRRRRLLLLCSLLIVLLAAPFILHPAHAATPVPTVRTNASGSIVCLHNFAIRFGYCLYW